MYKRLLSILLLSSIVFFLFMNSKEEKNSMVRIYTLYGEITIKLYNETPLHRDNFLKLCSTGFYDSLLFHRIIKDFMIQGGDPASKNSQTSALLGTGGPGYTVKSEFNKSLIHRRGALAAARLGDNSNPDRESSGSQFYIVQGTRIDKESLLKLQNQRIEKKKSIVIQQFIKNPENAQLADSMMIARTNKDRVLFDRTLKQIEIELKDEYSLLDTLKYTEDQIEVYASVGGTPHLDFEYTVFGEVIDGMNVVDSIASIETDRSGRPIKDIVMKIEILKY